MKKYYSLLLVTLMSLFGLPANALTLTFKGDPKKIEHIYASAAIDDIKNRFDEEGWAVNPNAVMKFSPEGEVNDLGNIKMLYISVKTVSGETFSYTPYKADGTKAATKTKQKSDYYQNVMSVTQYDGGGIEVTVDEEVAKIPFTVEFEGTPSKVSMTIGQATKTLVVGTNSFECTADDYVCFNPKGVSQFYLVKHNETEIPVLDNMGVPTYQIQGSKIKAGDVITVKTDYPQTPINVSVSSTDWGYVSSVKIDNVAIAPEVYQAGAVEAFSGQTFSITCAKNDYVLNKLTINDNVIESFSGSYSVVLEEDLSIAFDVTLVERDKKFNLKFGAQCSGEIRTNSGAFYSYGEESNNEVAFGDLDLPMILFPLNQSSSTSDNRVAHILRNDVLVAWNVSRYNLTSENLADGDNYVVQYVKPEFFVNITGAEYCVVTLYGSEVELTEGDNTLTVLADQENEYIKFAVKEGCKLTTATINGSPIYPVDGEYRIKPKDMDQFVIVAEQDNPQIITINVNNAAGLFYGGFVMLREGYVEIADGMNEIDLDDYPVSEWGGDELCIAPNSGYAIAKMMYNGEDVTGNEDYYYGGAYYFVPEAGDAYDVTVEKITRNDHLVVFAQGLENVRTPYILDYAGTSKLIDVINEGYNDVYFSAAYDTPLLCAHSGLLNGAKAYVYLNNTEVAYDYGYNIEAANDDVLKLYFVTEKPQMYAANIIVHGSNLAPEVVVDGVKAVDLIPEDATVPTYTHSELQGTAAVLSAPAGDVYNEVAINGVLVAKDETYAYTLDANTTIEIYANEEHHPTVGIETIGEDSVKHDIYNVVGVKMNGKNMPAGIYIVGGKRVVKR